MALVKRALRLDERQGRVRHNDQAILAECVRGENVAIRVYDEALRKELSGDVRALVERQYLHLRDAHDFVRSFETVESAS